MEASLEKRAYWLEGKDKNTPQSEKQIDSAQDNQTKPGTASISTQYETESKQPLDGNNKDSQGVTSNTKSIKNSASKKKERKSMPIKQINITFPSFQTAKKDKPDDVKKRGVSKRRNGLKVCLQHEIKST